MIERTTCAGLEAVRLGNDDVELYVTTEVGPRVMGFAHLDRPSLFAAPGDAGLDLPDGRRFTFHGGHRLWVAPEVPERTHEPDDQPVEIAETDDGLSATATVGGLEKAITVSLGEGATANVVHRLVNRTGQTVELAPWAITMLGPGGTGLLPLYHAPPDGLQASSLLVGWPYTDFRDPGIHIGVGLVLVDGRRTTPTKIGTDLSRGWLAYVLGEQVFVKRATHHHDATYVDLGANAQLYCNDQFLELETLGPLVTLAPGEATEHAEAWSLHGVDPTADAAEIPHLLQLD